LRAVNATPPLYQATTGSVEALRKYSESVRANTLGDDRAIALAREAVAIDSTFASAWSALAAGLSNYGGKPSSIDSAVTQAYRHRERLPALERGMVTGRYFALGPGRDRAKAIAAYEAILQGGDSVSAVMVNLAEMYRSRREFARAESLNLAAVRQSAANGTALGNAIELEIDQGKLEEAAANVVRLKAFAAPYGVAREVVTAYAQGDDRRVRAIADTMVRLGGAARRRIGIPTARSLAILDGRLREYATLTRENVASQDEWNAAGDVLYSMSLMMAARGPSPASITELDSAIAKIPFRDLPMVDRPYLNSVIALAIAGNAEKARGMLARYRSEMTDTSLRRIQTPELHEALAEIALAAGKPQEALDEFRVGDVGFDGAPADECAACLSFNLGRAYDAAGKPDSAAAMFERYLATPYWLKAAPDMDPVRLPLIRERLGQLYESMGNTNKAAENYRAFIDLWKNADPDLQPRVADARRRLAKLTPVETPKP